MPDNSSSYILEFTTVGRATKVTAVDPDTGTEVSIVGPADAGQALLSRNAVNKLEYMLKKAQT